MLRKLKQIWYWYWGDGSTAHPSIPPYTFKVVLLVFVVYGAYRLIAG